MKPILLEVEAFGAFADKQTLDFQLFDEARLFLIHGPTGAGKTTLFDAMCYALYGETTNDRKPDSMRSDHVGEEAVSRVNFIFRVGHQYYKAERTFYKVKKRKKEDQDKVEFTHDQSFGRINAKTHEWEENSLKKVGEIEHRVEQILGFSAKQFKQIVILPQGRFQELLTTTNADAKKEILIKIFNAHIYKEITVQLKTQATLQRKAIKEREQAVKARLEAIHIESTDTLTALIQDLETQLAAGKAQLPALEIEYKSLHTAFEFAKQLMALHIDLEATQIALDTHNQRQEQIQQLENQRNRATEADLFRKSIERIEAEREKIIVKQNEIRTNQSIIIKIEDELQKIQAKLTDLEDEEDAILEIKQKMTDLEKLKPKFSELDDLQAELTKIEKNYADNQINITTSEALRATQQKTIEEKNQPQIEAQQMILNQLSGLEIKAELFEKYAKLREERKKALTEYDKCKKDFDNSEKDLKIKSEKYDSLKINLENLDLRWRKSQSALLAESLIEGKPCSVCGSTSHPNKAIKTDDFVSNEDLDATKQARNQAEKAYDLTKTTFQDLKSQLEEIKLKGKSIAEQLGEWKDKDDDTFIKTAQETHAQLKQAREAEGVIQRLKKENQALADAIKALDSTLKSALEEAQRLQGQMIQTKAEIKNIRQTLPENLKNEADLENELDKLIDKVEKYEAEKEQLQERKKTKEEDLIKRHASNNEINKDIKQFTSDLEDLEKELKRELKKKNFADVADLQNALLEEADKSHLQKEIDSWKTRNIELETHKQKTEKQINAQPKPDLGLLQIELAGKEQSRDTSRELITQQETELKNLQNQQTEIAALAKELSELEAKAKDLFELSDLASGNNTLNQDFQTHVLSAFLDEVIDFANARLRVLSQERYELRRTEEITHGNRQAGLDLKVFDSYSGKERFVQNLSGGETFFTSLALALGLADVATVKAGGIHLDSMFIDEGFGTLDSTTLDLAIQTLMNLDGEYRMVGIISHVAELKERIGASRVEVVKGQKGSTLRVHVK